MDVPQRIYEVSGENESPAVFEAAVFVGLQQRKKLAITAREIPGDELVARRDAGQKPLEFEFQVRETLLLDDKNVYSGYMFENNIKGEWIRIEVTTNHVRFTLYS